MQPTKSDRFSVVYSSDPCVGEGADPLAYYESLEERHQCLTGEPVRYVLRPASRRERDWIMGERVNSENASVLPYSTLAVCLVEVVGPDGPILTAADLDRKRRLVGGVRVLPDSTWDNETAFPGAACLEVGSAAFGRMFR